MGTLNLVKNVNISEFRIPNKYHLSWLKSSSSRFLFNLRFACEILLVPGMYLNIILTSEGSAVVQCCFHKMKKWMLKTTQLLYLIRKFMSYLQLLFMPDT